MNLRVTILVFLTVGGVARADVRTKAVQEAAEAVMARFGSRAGASLPALAAKIETLAARCGEEALVAVRRVGPEAFTLIEEGGPKAAKVLAQYGEEGATCVLRRPQAMKQLIRYGDEAAAVLVKHPGVAEGLVEQGGMSAVRALEKVTPQGARRIAMVMEGELKDAAKPALLDVVAKYGQRACDFIWENKGSLAAGTTLVAFLANPEPFINGVVQLGSVATEKTADAVARPIAEGVAKSVNWNLIVLILLAFAAFMGFWRFGFPRRKASQGEKSP